MSVPSLPASGLPAYSLACPNCGAQLSPHVGLPQNAPWLCINCRHGWWVAELSASARQRFRPAARDFGHDGTVASSVAVERAAAIERGNSVHPSMTNLPGIAAELAKFQGKA